MRIYLKQLRERQGLTQNQLAYKLNVAQNYYSDIENGHRQKRMDLLIAQKLATAFGVPLEQILQEEMKLQSTTN